MKTTGTKFRPLHRSKDNPRPSDSGDPLALIYALAFPTIMFARIAWALIFER